MEYTIEPLKLVDIIEVTELSLKFKLMLERKGYTGFVDDKSYYDHILTHFSWVATGLMPSDIVLVNKQNKQLNAKGYIISGYFWGQIINAPAYIKDKSWLFGNQIFAFQKGAGVQLFNEACRIAKERYGTNKFVGYTLVENEGVITYLQEGFGLNKMDSGMYKEI